MTTSTRNHVLARSALCVSTTLAGLGLAAQQQTFTSPKGFDAKEGGSSHGYILADKLGLTWQQLDSTLKGAPIAGIRSIAWRRDGNTSTSATFGARTLELEVVLAHTVRTSVTTDHGKNYKDTPVVVFTRKSVNFADWSQKPTSTPAPFSNRLPFDTPWNYNGTDDLLWEVRVTKNSRAGDDYPFDFHYVGTTSSYTSDVGVKVGDGCTATGQSSPFALSTTFYNHDTKWRIRLSASRAPANAPVVGFLDFVNLQVGVPGLCAKLGTRANTPLALGTASTSGSLASTYFDNLPPAPALVGMKLYFQGAAVDAGQAGIPVALSDVREITIPDAPKPVMVNRVYSYLSGTSTIKSGPWNGGIIAQFGY